MSEEQELCGEVKLAIRQALEPFRDEAFNHQQGTLFDTGGVLILTNERRIGKQWARRSHFEEHLRLSDSNLLAVVAANNRDHRIYDLLRPYWDKGVTMKQAIKGYRSDHPDTDEFVGESHD